MSKKILIVDDEPHLRLLLEQTLAEFEDRGVEIFTAENGDIALEIIKTEKPNIVFLDVTMPMITTYEECSKKKELKIFEEPRQKNEAGYEVCRLVKKELKMNYIYIVMLTAKGQEIDKKKGFDSGVDVYLNKPFDPAAIIALTGKILNV